jgi:phosphoglycerate kinase
VCRYLPAYAGWRLAEEVAALDRVSIRPRRPFVLVLGGAKAHDKIALMIKLAPRATVILLAGVVANTLLRMKGIDIGRSRFDEHPAVASLKELMKKRQAFLGLKEKVNLLELPLDVVAASGSDGAARLVDFSAGETLKPEESIYDIGPKTMRRFSMFLRKAKTIVWNGPMGMIEQRRFRHGSLVIAEMIAARSKGEAFGLVGGGETIAVLNETGMAEHIDYISTGGGAMLQYLSGQELPGLKPLFK